MNKFVLLWALTLSYNMSSAQTLWSIKAGLNLAKFKATATIPGFGSGSATSDNLTSFHAGFTLRAPISSEVSIQPEVLYSGQGGSSQGVDLTTDYINVPIMLQYHASPNFNLQFGPQLGFLISAEAAGQSVMDDLETFDFALGFGFEAAVGGPVSLGFRYNLGLSNFSKMPTGAPAGTTLTTTNQVMQFSVGLRLGQRVE